MDKVLFLLCIPEEEEETDNTTKTKQNATKTTDKPPSSQEQDKAKSDTVVDAEPKGTSVDNCTTLSEDEQKAVGEDTSAETIGTKPLQNEKAQDSGCQETGPTTFPTQTITSSASANAPTDTKNKADSPPELVSATSKTVGPVSDNTEKETPERGQERAEDDTAETRETLPAASPAADTTQGVEGEDTNPEESGLITMDMLGKELTDDFWDFVEAGQEKDLALSGGVDIYLPDSDDLEGTQQEQPKEASADVQQQTRKEDDSTQKLPAQPNEKIQIPAMKGNTDASDVFVTCPNTPILSSNKSQNPVLSKDEHAQKLSNKFTVLPLSENSNPKQPEQSKTDVSDVETKPVPGQSVQKENTSLGQSSKPDKAGETTITEAKPQQISDKFLTIPVKEDVDPVKPITKSASAGEIENRRETLRNQPTDTVNTDKTMARKYSLDSKVKIPQMITGKSDAVDDSTELMDFLPKLSLKTLVRNCLSDLGVMNIAWQKCTGDRTWQVTFIEDAGMRCENVMLKLAAIGVGRVQKSSISVIPVSIHAEKELGDKGGLKSESAEQDCSDETARQIEEKTTEFQKSIKSRLVVRQVVKSVESNAMFTFDYVMFIILASLISVLGLVENSSVVLVASMLISPLMGPILAGTFGIVIKNNSLRDLGIRSELYGLGLCIISGFVFGLVPAGLDVGSPYWKNADAWPTQEMSSRGVLRGLAVGMMIALPSGAGVALSVLGGNSGSLVGVAISASLLPPAVNAGMLWSAALMALWAPRPLVMQTKIQNISEIINGTLVSRNKTTFGPVMTINSHGLLCPQVHNNEFEHVYFCNAAADFAALASVSLLLTILNIICIFIMGIVVLKIKEVAPRTSTQMDQNFFKKDIKIARESYTTTKGPQSAMMGKKWLEEYKAMKQQMELGDIAEEESDTIEFQQILESVENSPEVKGVLSRVPSSQPRPVSEELAPVFHGAAVRHLEKHPELVEPVYHTFGYTASGTTTPLPGFKMHSVYHTVRSPWNLSPNPQASIFMFPPAFNLRPDSVPSTPKFAVPARHAPISGDKTSDDESDDQKHPPNRRPRLHIPKYFHVTQLEDKSRKGRGSTEQTSEQSAPESEAGTVQKQGKKPPGKKGKKYLYQKRNPRRVASPLTNIIEVDAEAPLLEIGSMKADTKEAKKTSKV